VPTADAASADYNGSEYQCGRRSRSRCRILGQALEGRRYKVVEDLLGENHPADAAEGAELAALPQLETASLASPQSADTAANVLAEPQR